MRGGFTVIDAEGLILGRMASIVAKRLLNGERIIVVNAEKAVISGSRKNIIGERKRFLEVGGARRGPIHWRRPDRIVWKTIRGMLPRYKPRGKVALKRLRVYIRMPNDLKGMEKETLKGAHVSKLKGRFVTVGEVAQNIGWTP